MLERYNRNNQVMIPFHLGPVFSTKEVLVLQFECNNRPKMSHILEGVPITVQLSNVIHVVEKSM